MKHRVARTGLGRFLARATVVAAIALLFTSCNQSVLKYLIEQGGVNALELPTSYLYLNSYVSSAVAELFDPAQPNVVFSGDRGCMLDDFQILPPYGYIRNAWSFSVYDVSKPWQFEWVNSVTVESNQSLAVNGSWAYALATPYGSNSTVEIYSLATPSSPVWDETVDLGHENLGGGTIHLADDSSWVMVATGVEFMLIDDPAEGLGAASIAGSVTTTSSGSILDRGDYVYVTGYDVIDVIDISDYETPTIVNTTIVSGFHVFQTVWMGDTYGDKLLVACGEAELYVVDVSSPTAPVVTGPFGGKAAYDVTVRGEYAYVAHDPAWTETSPVGFSVYDLTDLSAPINSYQTDFLVTGIYSFE